MEKQEDATMMVGGVQEEQPVQPQQEAELSQYVQVRFFTKSYPHRVPDTPVVVDVELTRFGLSELVNSQLGNTNKPVPFDFLIEHQFLRTSLDRFLRRRHISRERVLEVEYIEAQPAPQSVESIPHSDWISSIAISKLCHSENAENEKSASSASSSSSRLLPVYLLTGCYDGQIRLLDVSSTTKNQPTKQKQQSLSTTANVGSSTNSTELATATHDCPVRQVIFTKQTLIPNNGNDEGQHHAVDSLSFITATKDDCIRVWNWKSNNANKNNKKCELQLILKGHVNTVECIDVETFSANSQFCCSGSWDRTIRIWNIQADNMDTTDDHSPSSDNDDEDDDDDGDGGSARKKRKVVRSKKEPQSRSELSTLIGHTLAVSAVVWGMRTTLYSGSWDHTIRLWDVNTGVNTRTLAGSQVCSATGMDFHPDKTFLLTGHPDKLVRMWDPRSTTTTASVAQFKGHKGWVRAVKWVPTNPHQFVSCGDDGVAKLWDTRSTTPFHTIRHHPYDEKEAEAAAAAARPTPASEEEELAGTAYKDADMLLNPEVLPQEVKVLSLAWHPITRQLFTGGSDCVLQKHTWKSGNQKK